MPRSHVRPLPAERLRSANRRTGALLSAIAFVFFAGVIASHYLGGVTAGLAVLGVAIMLYLAVAIGRSIGGRK